MFFDRKTGDRSQTLISIVNVLGKEETPHRAFDVVAAAYASDALPNETLTKLAFPPPKIS
jgi:hypothetical protein